MAPESDSVLLHLIEGVSFNPIFIIGDHRSGTTLLYKILADTGSFQVFTAYHVIQYDKILVNHQAGRELEAKRDLAARFAELGISDRIIDSVVASPDTPEEYGFVLEDSRRPRVRRENLARMVELCRKLQFTQSQSKPLLLKNPWDVLSFVDLKTFFPNAKFVFLHRHPIGVINSQLRAIRSLISARNEYTAILAKWYARMSKSPLQLAAMRLMFSSGSPIWRSLVPRHVLRANRYFAENIGKLPPEDCFALCYEDLCRTPRITMEKLMAFLGAQPEVPPSYESMISQRDPELLPEVKRHQEEMMRPFEPYLAMRGYK